uniref:SH2 domain-containing protein n=1 Tax=Eptatretus burgeri TaxID=7764 RepID=A0A8C4R4C8_EPTBU
MNDPPVNRPVVHEENSYEGYISTSFDDPYAERINLDENTIVEPVQNEKLQLKLSTASRTWTFEVDTQEQAMLWEATILTVTQNKIPQHLNLLPGQKVMLEEILQGRLAQKIEEDRQKRESLPEYYFDVKRDEAEKMLMESEESGCYLLRPTSDGMHICLSVKQPKCSSVQHFKIIQKGSDYFFDRSHSATINQKSLQDIIDVFLNKYSSVILPYTQVRYASVYDHGTFAAL